MDFNFLQEAKLNPLNSFQGKNHLHFLHKSSLSFPRYDIDLVLIGYFFKSLMDILFADHKKAGRTDRI